MAPYSHAHGYRADRNPSAGAVTDERGRASRWSCHACKAHGTIFDLAMELKRLEDKSGIDYDAIGEEIISLESEGYANVQFGQDLGFEPPPEPLVEEAYEDLWPSAWGVPAARFYLQRRAIGQRTAERLALLFDAQHNRIMFPVRDREGRLFGWSGRAIGENKIKVLDYEGLPKRHLILGAHLWEEGLPVVIVEGLFAYARMHELDLPTHGYNVGALLGSELTEEKAEIIRNHGEPTYMFVDGDAAGDACIFGPIIGDDPNHRDERKGAIALLQGHVPLFIPAYPEGKDDPDQLTLDEVFHMMKCPPYGFDTPASFS